MRTSLAALLLLLGCATVPGPYSDPEGVQLSLFGDRKCSDPVYGQTAMQCCQEHDNSFTVGGTRQDFHIANAEFLVCMLLWDVPLTVALDRYEAVSHLGWKSWNELPTRTRGP